MSSSTSPNVQAKFVKQMIACDVLVAAAVVSENSRPSLAMLLPLIFHALPPFPIPSPNIRLAAAL